MPISNQSIKSINQMSVFANVSWIITQANDLEAMFTFIIFLNVYVWTSMSVSRFCLQMTT